MPELGSHSYLRLLAMPRPRKETDPVRMQYLTESELEDLARRGAVAFTPEHSVRDILRYAVDQLGGDVELAMFHLSEMRRAGD